MLSANTADAYLGAGRYYDILHTYALLIALLDK